MKNLRNFLNSIFAWLERLVTTLNDARQLDSKKSQSAQELAGSLSIFASGILSSIVASWVVQDLLRYSFPFVVIVAFAMFFLFTTILQTRWLKLQLSAYTLFTVMLSVIIIQSIGLAWLYVVTRPPTVYVLLDATAKTEPYYDSIVQRLFETTEVQPPNSRGGLRVYGGNLSGDSGCSNTMQLIEPMPIDGYGEEVKKVLGKITPSGNSSLTVAVLEALKNDLKQYRGPVKLIIVTSGIDAECDSLESDIFEALADDIKKNTRDDITIVIFGVGDISTEEQNTLVNYAKAYSGKFFYSENAEALLSVIVAPPSYISNYPNLIQPTPTKTP